MPDNGQILIAGDIGGTKSQFGVFAVNQPHPALIKEARFENIGYSCVEDVLSAFLETIDAKGVSSLCLAVACPVEGNCGTLTNLNWHISAEAIAKRFCIPSVHLINDLAATAIGSLQLSDADLFVLQEGLTKTGNRALIAAGTGLGQAVLFWDGKSYQPSASEGGHTDFAPRSTIEIELLDYLTKIYGHVSYERILSGPGLEAIYAFFKSRDNGALMRIEASNIAEMALNNSDKTCSRALSLFVSIYGAEAGNLALKTMATGGVYIGGGIAPKILKALQGEAFLKAFKDKGRFENWLSQIPVHVILNQKTALLGAASYAARFSSQTVLDAPLRKSGR